MDKTKQAVGPEMNFGDHLEELRSRIIKSVLFTIVTFIVIFAWHQAVLRFVVEPYAAVARDLRMDGTLKVLGPTQSFFAYMKVSLIVALLVSAPAWMYQFWSFIGAGLYSHEKKAVYKFAPPMVFLFAAGVSFGYLVLIPVGLRYLLSFADPAVLQNWIGLSEYLSLFTTLTLVLGITFQLPVVMALLTKIGVMSVRTFREKRRYFILGAFVFGALLTPPDAITQILLATPLVFLFELGIGCAWWVQKGEREPIDWPKWRKRGLVFAGVILLLAYFQAELLDSYRARIVGQKLHHVDVETTAGMPYFKLFKDCKFVPFAPEAMFQIKVDDDEELVLVGGEGKSLLLRMYFRDDRVTKTSEFTGRAHFLVNSSARSAEIVLVKEMPGIEFMGLVMHGLENSSLDDVASLEALLAGLVGERPTGARALTESDEEEAILAVRELWLAWGRGPGKNWVYRRPS